MAEKNPFKLLSLEEAAETLGVDYRTVYRLVRKGDIPAGRVGRVYRINEKDLHAYFESTSATESANRQVPSFRTAAPIQTCETCGKELLSTLSVAGRCEVCGSPICAACWAVKKLRRCELHAVAGDKTPPRPVDKQNAKKIDTPPVAESRASSKQRPPASRKTASRKKSDTAAAKIDELRAKGVTVATYGEATSLRDRFLRSFVQRVELLEHVPDHTGAEIRVREARVRMVEPEPSKTGSLNGNGLQFVIRTGGWGKPKHCVVMETRILGRFDRLESQRYDDELLDQEIVSQAIHGLVRDKSAKPYRDAFRFVFAACTPGLAEDAASVVEDVDSIAGFYDKRILVALFDAGTEAVHYPKDDERYWPFLPIIDPIRWKNAVDDATPAVEKSLKSRGSLSLDDAVRRLGVARPIAREVFRQLSLKGMRLDDIDGIGVVISASN